jgi:hypothetical protein
MLPLVILIQKDQRNQAVGFLEITLCWVVCELYLEREESNNRGEELSRQ